MNKIKTYPQKAKDVPVTQDMLYGVRDELKEYTNSKFEELKVAIKGNTSEIHSLKSEISGNTSEIHSLKSEISGNTSEIHSLKADIHTIKSDVHAIKILVEEQNAKNNIVLDGLTSLFDRQERLEAQFK